MVRPDLKKLSRAKHGFAPASKGRLILLPRNGNRKLASTEGASTNYGGNAKMGLYPNIGIVIKPTVEAAL